MFVYGKSTILGNFYLPLLDFGVIEFFHPAALQADQMIVVSAAGELEHGLAAFKMVPLKQPRLFELGEYPIYGGKTDVLAFVDEGSINIFGGEMAHRAALEQAQYSKPRQRGLQAHGFQIVRVTHS